MVPWAIAFISSTVDDQNSARGSKIGSPAHNRGVSVKICIGITHRSAVKKRVAQAALNHICTQRIRPFHSHHPIVFFLIGLRTDIFRAGQGHFCMGRTADHRAGKVGDDRAHHIHPMVVFVKNGRVMVHKIVVRQQTPLKPKRIECWNRICIQKSSVKHCNQNITPRFA